MNANPTETEWEGRTKAILQKLRQDKGYVCLQINLFHFCKLGREVLSPPLTGN